MYKFTDITDWQDVQSLPSVAMEYDGYFLENEIQGYETLKVKGREMLNVDIESENPSGRNGSYITGQTLPSRELTVTYMLKAESNEAFQYKYSLLMKKLLKFADVGIRFIDQKGVFYYGRYAGNDDVPDDRNWVVSSFTIFCQDPYKYNKPIVLTGDPLIVGYDSHYAMKPDEIKVVLGANASKITIDNVTTGGHIILNGTYTTGQEIKITVPQNKVTRNGQDIMNNLDYMESDFHNFLINTNDVINVTPNSTMSITLRGRTL